jgi:hypothetical protein
MSGSQPGWALQIRPGDQVLICTWWKRAPQDQMPPEWKWPYVVILATFTAIKVQGIDNCIHFSRWSASQRKASLMHRNLSLTNPVSPWMIWNSSSKEKGQSFSRQVSDAISSDSSALKHPLVWALRRMWLLLVILDCCGRNCVLPQEWNYAVYCSNASSLALPWILICWPPNHSHSPYLASLQKSCCLHPRPTKNKVNFMYKTHFDMCWVLPRRDGNSLSN